MWTSFSNPSKNTPTQNFTHILTPTLSWAHSSPLEMSILFSPKSLELTQHSIMAISSTFTAAILTISYILLAAAARSSAAEDIHDLLPKYGLPRGLLPDAVKSYSLSLNGDFVVELTSECYVHFSYLVYYESRITGRVSYGQITDINGIQAKKLFFWVSVTSIVAKPDAKEIEFKAGLLSQSLPAAEFETVHECRSKVAGCGGLDGIVAEV